MHTPLCWQYARAFSIVASFHKLPTRCRLSSMFFYHFCLFFFLLFDNYLSKISRPFCITWSGFLGMLGIMHDVRLLTTAWLPSAAVKWFEVHSYFWYCCIRGTSLSSFNDVLAIHCSCIDCSAFQQSSWAHVINRDTRVTMKGNFARRCTIWPWSTASQSVWTLSELVGLPCLEFSSPVTCAWA